MNVASSVSSKKIPGGTWNNWVTMLFVAKKRYNCFRKQAYADTCTKAFQELERFGHEFGDFGFAKDHFHFQANIPKRHSVQDAESMIESYSAKRMSEIHPGFRKRYLQGSFWSRYEHHQSTGLTNLEGI